MRINLFTGTLITIFTIICLSACASIQKGLKETTLDDMYPILSEEQYKTLDSLMSDEEITKFLEKFWKDNDPTPATDKNELREEFMRRLEYANFWFPDRRGWGRSDRKKIYLVYGPPFDIERYEFTGLEYGLSTKIKSLEI